MPHKGDYGYKQSKKGKDKRVPKAQLGTVTGLSSMQAMAEALKGSLPASELPYRGFEEQPVNAPTALPATDAGPTLPEQASSRAKSVAGGQQGALQRSKTKVTIESEDGTPVDIPGGVKIGGGRTPVDPGIAPPIPIGIPEPPPGPIDPGIAPPTDLGAAPTPPPIRPQVGGGVQSLVNMYFQQVRAGNQQAAYRIYKLLQAITGNGTRLGGAGITPPSNVGQFEEAFRRAR